MNETLAHRAVSLLQQGRGRTSEDLEGAKQAPALDQDLESNWNFQEHIDLLSVCVHRAQIDKLASLQVTHNEHVI